MTFRTRKTPTLYRTNMPTLPTQITRGRPQWKTMQIRPGQNIWGTEAQSRWPCLWSTESPGPEWGVWLNRQLPQAASLTLRQARAGTGTDKELTVNKNHLKESKAAVGGQKAYDKYAKLKERPWSKRKGEVPISTMWLWFCLVCWGKVLLYNPEGP